MRIVIAGLIGAVVLFFWGFVAHTLLPLGNIGMRAPGDEDAVLSAMRAELPGEGVYYLPYLAPERMADAAAMQAWSEKAKTSPYALVVYQPEGRDGTVMGPQLGIQFGGDLAACLLLASLLATRAGWAQRVATALAVGLVGWLAIALPYWNWYRFPLDFSLALLVEQALGFLLAGLAIAGWLGRGEGRT